MKDNIQEQLAVARKNQILEAAAKVFARKGFHPTTIKDIAKEAGIADGTIYIYFENKTALLVALIERMRETAVAQSDFSQLNQPGVDFRTFLRAYLREPLLALRANNFELFRVLISEIAVNPELRELYREKILEPTLAFAEQNFEQWAQKQAIKPENVRLTFRVIYATISGLILQNIMGDTFLEEHWENLPDFLTDMFLDGIAF